VLLKPLLMSHSVGQCKSCCWAQSQMEGYESHLVKGMGTGWWGIEATEQSRTASESREGEARKAEQTGSWLPASTPLRQLYLSFYTMAWHHFIVEKNHSDFKTKIKTNKWNKTKFENS
jgi:hypothetical protein